LSRLSVGIAAGGGEAADVGVGAATAGVAPSSAVVFGSVDGGEQPTAGATASTNVLSTDFPRDGGIEWHETWIGKA
jgi:hypothetical protein